MQVFLIINTVEIMKNVDVKGFIWNPSNCECACDKSCDVREYLDYKNYKCKKN